MTGPLYPLKFEPVLKPTPWGGRRLPGFVRRPAAAGPVGEAWVLSDVDGAPTRVANGRLAGAGLRDLLAAAPQRLLGPAAAPAGRFPLLLKFLDADAELSVQVHPTDAQARAKHPAAAGKTEAWVVLAADPARSRIYAGFRPGVTAADFRAAVAAGTAPDALHAFTPAAGDCVFLPAGTVHAIGAGLLLFEVQQTSDITYRLYDWGRVGADGRPRDLHLDDGLACSDFTAGPCRPVAPTAGGPGRERLVGCDYFTLDRLTTAVPTTVGAPGRCRAVVMAVGRATVGGEPAEAGDVVLLPAEVGAVDLVPDGPEPVVALECGPGERPA